MRSSRLTWAGSEIRAATALTAKVASGRCSVTNASTSRAERSPGVPSRPVAGWGRACGRRSGADRPREVQVRAARSVARGAAVTFLSLGCPAARRNRPGSRHGLDSGADPTDVRADDPRVRLEAPGPGADACCDEAPPTDGAGDDGSTTERRWGAMGGTDYQHLSTLLWREQELLDLLLFKAEEK